MLFRSIGTLLNEKVPKAVTKIVFGTGAGYGDPPVLDDSWKIYFLRGPLTASVLGVDKSMAVTDGAIMCAKYLPLPTNNSKRTKVGFMPHCSSAQYEGWERICQDMGLLYIDPRKKVDEVFQQLALLDRLLTEAMHGAILADTFRIPWVPIKTNKSILDFKWKDWCLSMNVPYKPIHLPALWSNRADVSFMRKLRRATKALAGKFSLRKAVNNARYQLSTDDTHRVRIEQIEESFSRFRKDYAKGIF